MKEVLFQSSFLVRIEIIMNMFTGHGPAPDLVMAAPLAAIKRKQPGKYHHPIEVDLQ